MPVIVVDLKVPAVLEEGTDLMMSRLRRIKRRLRINWSRRMSMIRYGLRTFYENMKGTEDERPILKREGELFQSSHCLYFDVARRSCWLCGC